MILQFASKSCRQRIAEWQSIIRLLDQKSDEQTNPLIIADLVEVQNLIREHKIKPLQGGRNG